MTTARRESPSVYLLSDHSFTIVLACRLRANMPPAVGENVNLTGLWRDGYRACGFGLVAQRHCDSVFADR